MNKLYNYIIVLFLIESITLMIGILIVDKDITAIKYAYISWFILRLIAELTTIVLFIYTAIKNVNKKKFEGE